MDFSTLQVGQLEEEMFSSISIAREDQYGPCSSVVFLHCDSFTGKTRRKGILPRIHIVFFKDLFKARLFHKPGLQQHTVPLV